MKCTAPSLVTNSAAVVATDHVQAEEEERVERDGARGVLAGRGVGGSTRARQGHFLNSPLRRVPVAPPPRAQPLFSACALALFFLNFTFSAPLGTRRRPLLLVAHMNERPQGLSLWHSLACDHHVSAQR